MVAFADDSPVGFAHVEVIEPGAVHLEEIDVHPDHGRRGLGTKLIRHVCHWAASHGFEAVTVDNFSRRTVELAVLLPTRIRGRPLRARLRTAPCDRRGRNSSGPRPIASCRHETAVQQ